MGGGRSLRRRISRSQIIADQTSKDRLCSEGQTVPALLQGVLDCQDLGEQWWTDVGGCGGRLVLARELGYDNASACNYDYL